MIEVLTGKRETIIYEKNIPIRMHLNINPEDFPLHRQNSFEIIMPLEGEYTLTIEEKVEKLTSDDIIIISPGVLHSISAPPKGIRYILLVNLSIFDNISETGQIHDYFYPYTIFTKDTNPSCQLELKNLLNELWEEYSSDKPLKYISLYSAILTFFVLAGRNTSNQFFQNSIIRNPASHKYTDKFTAICTYINEHCSENISLTELAIANGFSESHFNRLFKQFTGISYYVFLNHSRITQAKNLLNWQSNMTILDISMQCGFSSLSTFNRTFKSITKLTPSEFRKLHER